MILSKFGFSVTVISISLVVFSSPKLWANQNEESAFEIEQETVDIRDTQAEQQQAAIEAKRQESEASAAQKNLAATQARLDEAKNRATQAIATAEARRIKALADYKTSTSQMASLNKQIDSLDREVIEKQAAQKNAEALAKAGKDELSKALKRRNMLLASRNKAQSETLKSEAMVQKLRADYQRTVANQKEITKSVQRTTTNASKVKSNKNQLEKKIATASKAPSNPPKNQIAQGEFN